MKANSAKTKLTAAIIDSGIDMENNLFENYIIDGISFRYNPKTGIVTDNDVYTDENGHGTSCASLIKRIAPDIGFYIVKILNKDAETHSKALLQALKHLLEKDIRLINLSLATVEEIFAEEIKEVCNLLKQRGKIIVCSLDNRNNKSFPAILDSVIGVKGGIFKSQEQFWYNRASEIQCIADIVPVYAPTINGAYWLFGGNSKATALFTGHIANILTRQPDISFEQLNEVLEQRACKNNWDENDIDINIDLFEDITPLGKNFEQEDIKMIVSILKNNLGFSEDSEALVFKKKLYSPQIGVNKFNCFDIIKDVGKKFGVKLDYEAISLNTFNSIYTLLDFVKKGEEIV